jgi:hypothetical protein
MNNIELFPSRIPGRVVTATEQKPGKTMGGYSPVSDTVTIPASDSAFARTVRLHESGHALWSRDATMVSNDFVSQAVEDAKIHGLLETSGTVRRDEVYTSLMDLRLVNKMLGNPDRALQGLKLLRAASILRKPDSSDLGVSKLSDLAGKFHPEGMAIVDSILDEIESGNIDEAKSLTRKFFVSDHADSGGESDEESGMEGESEGESEDQESSDSDSKPSDKPSESDKPAKPSDKPMSPGKPSESDKKPDGKGKPSKPLPPLPESMTKGNPDDYVPASVKMQEKVVMMEAARKDSEDGTITVITGDDGTYLPGGGPYPAMYVHTLSLNASRRVRGRGHNTWKSSEQGIKIRSNRLALNAANPCGGARLFQTRKVGGTVLIDASGSMCLEDKTLYDIAEKFPAGKVAYYSGAQDIWYPGYAASPELLENNWTGHLMVYAQNGKIRKDHGTDLPKRGNANLVDYQAILWLLKQPGPRYMMTDWGFTGPLDRRATDLLKQAVDQKKITVYRSMAELTLAMKKL